MNKKEQWADKVMNSLQGIERARPKDDLFQRIRTAIPIGKNTAVVSIQRLAWAAIAASVIIAINIYALKLRTDSAKSEDIVRQHDISLLTEYSF